MYDLHKYLILSYLLFYKKLSVLYVKKSYIVHGFVSYILFCILLTLAHQSQKDNIFNGYNRTSPNLL